MTVKEVLSIFLGVKTNLFISECTSVDIPIYEDTNEKIYGMTELLNREVFRCKVKDNVLKIILDNEATRI